MEQQRGEIITPGEDFPLKAVNFPVGAIVNAPPAIPKEPLLDKLRNLLKFKGLSPSAIDCYVGCPKQFFFRYLSNVRESVTVDQDGDRAGFGDLIHSVLKDFLEPHLNKDISKNDLDAEQLQDLFMLRLERDSLYPNLAYDIKKSLEQAGKNRLALFLKNLKPTKIVELESDSQAELELEDFNVLIHGRIDRVDERAGERYVLDYKTGRLHLPRKSFWEDESIWGPVLDDPQAIYHDGTPFLEKIKNSADSLQLPLYLLMDHRTSGEMPRQAALVELVTDGREMGLFDSKTGDEEREDIIERKIPALTELIIKNMLTENEFKPVRSHMCQWCSYREACGS
jgi:RecB family exonuclease